MFFRLKFEYIGKKPFVHEKVFLKLLSEVAEFRALVGDSSTDLGVSSQLISSKEGMK